MNGDGIWSSEVWPSALRLGSGECRPRVSGLRGGRCDCALPTPTLPGSGGRGRRAIGRGHDGSPGVASTLRRQELSYLLKTNVTTRGGSWPGCMLNTESCRKVQPSHPV